MKLAQKLLLTSLIVTYLAIMTRINMTSASPATYIWVDPQLMEGTPNGIVLVDIRVEDAPPTYAWEIYLSWNPDRLELFYIKRGDFLVQPPPPPAPSFTYTGYPKFDEANSQGEIRIACSLVRDVPWASGDGWLVRLGFIVQTPGAVHLDLFNTSLFDHVGANGYPAPTYYDNQDALVDATNFYCAGLDGWKIKVNGKAGQGLGIRTEVGTPNLLEAYISNTGTFDAQVKAFFEIRDASGYWLATVGSAVTTVPANSTTVLSAYWTAPGAGTYYITAYSLYSAPPYVTTVIVTDGFSRTLRLSAV